MASGPLGVNSKIQEFQNQFECLLLVQVSINVITGVRL
jgi:hypothetical protein